MDCRDVEQLAALSIDGEISNREQADLERHLAECPVCRREFDTKRWFQRQLRVKLQESADDLESPSPLRNRIQADLREVERSHSFMWRWALPATVGIAAAVVLSWGPADTFALDLEEAVCRHTSNQPPEVLARGGARDVHRFFEQNLQFQMEVPRFDRPNLRLVGARLAHLKQQPAAHLMYDARGARISLFAKQGSEALKAPETFQQRTVSGRAVLVGRHRGYNVVLTSWGTVVYSLVSDVDDEELIQLAVTLHR